MIENWNIIINFLSQHGAALTVFVFAVLLFADKIFDVTSKLNEKFGFETRASLEKKHQKEVIEQQRLMIDKHTETSLNSIMFLLIRKSNKKCTDY